MAMYLVGLQYLEISYPMFFQMYKKQMLFQVFITSLFWPSFPLSFLHLSHQKKLTYFFMYDSLFAILSRTLKSDLVAFKCSKRDSIIQLNYYEQINFNCLKCLNLLNFFKRNHHKTAILDFPSFLTPVTSPTALHPVTFSSLGSFLIVSRVT